MLPRYQPRFVWPNANVFNRFLYLLYLFMWVHLRVKRLLRMCTDTSRSLSSLDQIRVVTYVTSRTSRFIKKKSHRAIKDYLACCENLSNNLRYSELFQAQTFLFLFFVISLFEKTSQWREEVNYICSLFFWKVTQHFLPILPTCGRIFIATVADQSIFHLFSILVINERNRIKKNKQMRVCKCV